MRNLKKFLALVMAMVMAFSLMLTVNAKDIVTEFSDRDQADAAFTEAVDVLSGMKVFQGDPEGTFRPASTITRAEVAALIYRLATGDVDDVRAGLYANYGNFADVSENDWFAGYVGYCANAGYIKGRTATTFDPYGQVTGYEVLAMVLRAAGYDKNHEFEGTTWQTNVSALSTQLHILDDVKTTHYGNTLHLASRRDVVASLLFNTADKVHMVEYTPIGGYNQYDNLLGSNLNPTLGYKNFGLTDEKAIILGNQATGEGCTLLGVNETTYTGTDDKEHTINTEYMYPGTVLQSDWVSPAVKSAGTITVGTGTKLAGVSGLDLFGHKVKAWYDDRDTGNKTTYAILDKAELSAIVHPTDDTDAYNYNLSVTDHAEQAKLGSAAKKAGFSVDLESSKAFFAPDFSRIQGYGGGVVTGAFNGHYDMRVQALKIDYSENDMYVLISNNSDKTVDVIVPVNVDVALIAQKDTVSKIKTLTLSDQTSTRTATSRFDNDDGVIDMKSIIDGSATALGDKVAAWRVIGTNNKIVYDAQENETGKAGTYSNDNGSSSRYYLDKLEKTTTGTVRTYGADKSLTLTDGTVIEQSWFRWQFNDGTGGAANSTGDNCDFVVGEDGGTKETFVVPETFEAGRTYTVALDNDGRWLGVTTESDEFIYATFGDYEVGALGTGTIGYSLTGVDWDGNIINNRAFTRVELDNAYSGDGNDADDSHDGKYYDSANADDVLGTGYNYLGITKKDLGDSSAGNRVDKGFHDAFMVSSSGVLSNTASTRVPVATAPIVYDTDDVKNGFADLNMGGVGKFLMTPETVFVVVSGTGSATLKTTVYKGIGELLGSAKSISIEPDAAANDAGYVYYRLNADRFNEWDTTDNKMIRTMILPEEAITRSTPENLFFSAPGNKATGVALAGTDPAEVEQYELYNNGVKSTYFVDITGTGKATGYATDVDGNPNGVGGADGGTFYTLTEIYKANGMPVYGATKITGATDPKMDNLAGDGDCNRGKSYKYVGVNNLSTALIGNEVFNVSNAVVVDVEYDDDTCVHDEIKSVKDLNDAVSGSAAYDDVNIKVAIVNDGVYVSVIYVTYVAPDHP